MELLLAKAWDPKIDPTGWWMSEKLDGIRAYWDGKQMFSRTGKLLYVPQHLLDLLPAGVKLDGELYAGRGRFQHCVSVVRTEDYSKDWASIRYLVFDKITDEPFEKRQADLICLRTPNCFWEVVKQQFCTGLEHLWEKLDEVEIKGGEGLMLRQRESLYEHKRSNTLLKVKTFHDAEAVVVGHIGGKGKHSNRLGAIECVSESGVAFRVGSGFTDAERESPPKVGSKITYKFQELTKDGVPRFPTYVRRYDEC